MKTKTAPGAPAPQFPMKAYLDLLATLPRSESEAEKTYFAKTGRPLREGRFNLFLASQGA